MKLMGLEHNDIKSWFDKGTITAEKILQKFEINAETASTESYISTLYEKILEDIAEMGYAIGYDSRLDETKRQSIPAVTTEYNAILLNPDYPEQAQLEALFHEYIHLIDDDPLSIKDNLGDKDKLIEIENLVDITTYILIMPPKQLKKNLMDCRFSINKILPFYKDFEKCTVLQWITLNNLFECHFAWVIYLKNRKEDVYDSCSYDQNNGHKYFDIDGVLATKDSAAAKAVKLRKNASNKNSKCMLKEHSKSSRGKWKNYKCYAYYESNLKGKMCDVNENQITFNFDRLLVIGWEKSVYDEWEKTTKSDKN